MESFSAALAFVRGIHRSPVNSPHKGQRGGASIFSLFCAWTKDWVNNRDAGDSARPLWRHCNGCGKRKIAIWPEHKYFSDNKQISNSIQYSNLYIVHSLWNGFQDSFIVEHVQLLLVLHTFTVLFFVYFMFYIVCVIILYCFVECGLAEQRVSVVNTLLRKGYWCSWTKISIMRSIGP